MTSPNLNAVYSPSPALRKYIEHFWVTEFDGPELEEGVRIAPSTSAVACFQYGAPIKSLTREGRICTYGSVTGLQKQHHVLQPMGPARTIVARFTPWGARRFFHMNASEFLDQHVELDSVWPREQIDRLVERLRGHSTPRERVNDVEAFLLSRLQDKHDRLVERVALDIHERAGTVLVSDLAQTYALSERQLERRFKVEIGTTPKHFARLVRLQHALLSLHHTSSSADLAFQLGYSDQSHFLRDFKDLMGCSPTEFRSRAGVFKALNLSQGTSSFFNIVFA